MKASDESPSVRNPQPTEEPESPRGVRIHYRNGRTIECPVKYTGIEDGSDDPINRGRHGWVVVNEGPFDHREGDRLVIDCIPSNAVVRCIGTGPLEHGEDRWAPFGVGVDVGGAA